MKTKIKITKNLFRRLNKLDIKSCYERVFLDKFEGKTIIFTKEEFTKFIKESDFGGIGCGQKNSLAGNILYYYLLLHMERKKAEDFTRKFTWMDTKTEVLIDYAFQLIEEEEKMNGLHLLVAFVIIGSILKYYLDKKYKPIYKKLQLFGYNIIIIK